MEVVPITAGNKGLLMRWVQANQSLKDLTRMVMDLGVYPNQGPMLEVLKKAYPLSSREIPFWNRVIGASAAIHESVARKTGTKRSRTKKKPLLQGNPMAHLIQRIGMPAV